MNADPIQNQIYLRHKKGCSDLAAAFCLYWQINVSMGVSLRHFAFFVLQYHIFCYKIQMFYCLANIMKLYNRFLRYRGDFVGTSMGDLLPHYKKVRDLL